MPRSRRSHRLRHRAAFRPTFVFGAVTVAALLAGVAALGPMALPHLSDTRVRLVGGDDAAADESPLATPPAERTGLGSLALDDPLDRAVSMLGPPDRQAPDINATVTHTWELAPGSELDVTGDEQGITGLAARVPADPPVRVAAHAGVIIGETTPAEVVDRWGGDHDVVRHPGEDFVLRYIECAGPFPVVIKFDQPRDAPEVRWGEPVTSVLIAYADAEPGTAGCPAP